MNRARLALVAALALASGCASTAVPPDHAAQDQAFYKTLAPRLAAYTVSDPALSSEKKARRLRTIAEWGLQVGATRTAAPEAEPPDPAPGPAPSAPPGGKTP